MKVMWITLVAAFLIAGPQLLLAEGPPGGDQTPASIYATPEVPPIPPVWVDVPIGVGGCSHGLVYGKRVTLLALTAVGGSMYEPCVGTVSKYRLDTNFGTVYIWLTPQMAGEYNVRVGQQMTPQYSFSLVINGQRVFHPMIVE